MLGGSDSPGCSPWVFHSAFFWYDAADTTSPGRIPHPSQGEWEFRPKRSHSIIILSFILALFGLFFGRLDF